MITIGNKSIDVSVYDILIRLRQDLANQGIFKLHTIKNNGDNIQITCPFHSNGNEKRPSAGVRATEKCGTEVGAVNCFACGYKAQLPKFISNCFNVNDNGEFGTIWLETNYATDEIYERPKLELDKRTKPTPRQYVSENELESYRYYHPYMYKRKLTNDIISKFDVGYDKDFILEINQGGKITQKHMGECLTFPTNDEFGNCLFITRRGIHNKFFHYPHNVDKPVYGLDKLPQGCKSVIVCESIINALTCYVYGYPAIALLGTGTIKQYEILKKSGIREYLLGFDGDTAGEKGANKFIENLSGFAQIKKLSIPNGKDINDLTKEEFQKILISCINLVDK